MSLGKKIFVIHGRDKRARSELFVFLRAIGLEPMEWSAALGEAGGGAPLISDVLDKVITADRAFIVLLTPDDVVQLKPEHADDEDDPELTPSGQARPNVLFEAGMAFGRHPENTVLVEFGKVRSFTDINGRYVVRLDDSPGSRNKLATRLKTIGCEVDTSHGDWLNIGDLTPPSTAPARRTASPRPPSRTATRQREPEPETPDAGDPEFTSDTGSWNVELSNFSLRQRRYGGVVVHGEVENLDQTDLSLALKATFFSTRGKILDSADGVAQNIRSGERKPFELTAFDEITDFTRVHVHIDMGTRP